MVKKIYRPKHIFSSYKFKSRCTMSMNVSSFSYIYVIISMYSNTR